MLNQINININCWFLFFRLTAFVMRSFARAQAFVFIDPATILESVNFLVKRQQENGCFAQSGKLFNNRMKVLWTLWCASSKTLSLVNDNRFFKTHFPVYFSSFFYSLGWRVQSGDTHRIHICSPIGNEHIIKCKWWLQNSMQQLQHIFFFLHFLKW